MTSPQVTSVPDAHDDPQTRRWEGFLKDRYREKVNEAALGWPDRRSLVIDYWWLDLYAPHIGHELLEAPDHQLAAAEKALRLVDTPLAERPELLVRIRNLPEHARIPVRGVRSAHVGKLIGVPGLVRKATEVRPLLQDAVFECGRCGVAIVQTQTEHLELEEPIECYEDQGGCGRNSKFKLLRSGFGGKTSTFVDAQMLEIQESPESVPGSEQPQRLTVFATNDLCSVGQPGDRVIVNGILRSTPRRLNGKKSTIFDLHLDAVSIELEEREFDDLEITPEDEEEIRRVARDPDVYQKLTASLAPSIYGMDLVKETLLLQLFGGVTHNLADGTRLRGDVHVLMVGDPGVAKSELLEWMGRFAPRAVHSAGKGSSGAGLTATATREDKGFGEGRWVLEAGAMVLADRGILLVDEMDKMSEEDTSHMHKGMEQQKIPINKAGISATFNTRCSVLVAANPKHGRFEPKSELAEQVRFPPALLSRFDVIFALRDQPDPQRDAQIAAHVMGALNGNGTPQEEPTRLTPEFVRKFVAYAKREVDPAFPPEVKKRMEDYYVGLRRQALASGGPVPMTPRQLHAIRRLSEASARVRLSPTVEAGDVDRAIHITESFLRALNPQGGPLDVDAVAGGVTHDQRQRIQLLKRIIREKAAGQQHGAPWDDVEAAAEEEGLEPERARALRDRLKKDGDLYQPQEGHWRVAK